jgi:hypothetical protein
VVLNEADAQGKDNQEAADSLRSRGAKDGAAFDWPAQSLSQRRLGWPVGSRVERAQGYRRIRPPCNLPVRRISKGYRSNIEWPSLRIRNVFVPESAERKVTAFISGADQTLNGGHGRNKVPTMIRVDPDLLERIDRGARRLWISRSAFFVSSAAKELERMES